MFCKLFFETLEIAISPPFSVCWATVKSCEGKKRFMLMFYDKSLNDNETFWLLFIINELKKKMNKIININVINMFIVQPANILFDSCWTFYQVGQCPKFLSSASNCPKECCWFCFAWLMAIWTKNEWLL